MYVNDDRDDVAFLTGSGSSESGPAYSKRDLYERGHVAVCSHRQATCITVFVFTSIFLTSLVIAFARPWNECSLPNLTEDVADETQKNTIPIATNGETFPWDDVRLPIFLSPILYDLELRPDLESLGVYGIIRIEFKVTEETDFIVFHMKGMNITSKKINEKLKIQRLLEYPEREQVYLETDKPMTPGKKFSVRLKFEYELSQSLEGFYLSTYKDKDGTERRLATTHFEPTYARRAFPCFDEPQLKAKFLVTIIHDDKHRVFFNMPLKLQTEVRGQANTADSGHFKVIPDWLIQRFNSPNFPAPTPTQPSRTVIFPKLTHIDLLLRDEFEATEKMSTYLLAFVICDFDLKTKQTPTNNISVSVIASKDKIDQVTFALDTAVSVTDYYEKYFKLGYPLPKQDLIAIPDFGAGAMENWGLITYRETSLLYKEGESSVKSQQWVSIVVAHELAHQWFGNLVTMLWWNDLWLNEGFASWMEYKGVDHVQPEWSMMEQFWSAKLVPALHLDSLASSHPVSVPVKDPKEIEAIFDTISYKKGSAIIHMLESYIGAEDLQSGLSQYLTEHQFGNAVTADLWRALSKASRSGVDVEQMMNTWTLQMGYPLVTLNKKEDGWWELTQSRFLTSTLNTTGQVSKYNFTWTVPVRMITNLGTEIHQLVLDSTQNSSNAHIQLPSGLKWLKANVAGSGYYRVQYPLDMWAALTFQLHQNHSVFKPVDRAQLMDDAFSLARAGQLSPSVPLEMVTYLVNETSLVPWETALAHLSTWAELLEETNARNNLKKFILFLIDKIYKKLDWQDQGSHLDRLLRGKILHAAVEADHGDAIKTAKEKFQGLRKNQSIPANLKQLVYSVGIRTGNDDDWSWCYEKYKNTNVPSDRAILLHALGETNNIFTIQNYLRLTLNKTQVRSQDVSAVLGSVANNPTGTLLAWRHLQRHWDYIWTMFSTGSFTMGNIIKSVTGHFSTQFDYNQVETFFKTKDVGAGRRALDQTLEEIQINIEFRRKYEVNISDWLHNYILKI